jgi:hypothetical protein
MASRLRSLGFGEELDGVDDQDEDRAAWEDIEDDVAALDAYFSDRWTSSDDDDDDDDDNYDDSEEKDDCMEFYNKDDNGEGGAMANMLETLGFNREEFEIGSKVDAEDNQEQDQGLDTEIENFDKEFRLADVTESKSTKDYPSQVFEVSFDEDNEALAEFIYALDPDNHLEILSTLLRHIEKPKDFTNQLLIKYKSFIKKFGV